MKAWSSGTHEARQRHGVPEIFVPASLVHSPLLPSLVAPFLTSLLPAVDVDEEANRLLDPVHPLWGSGLIASDAQQSSSARATTRARARHHHRPRCTSGRHLASTLPSRRRQPPRAPPTPPSPPLLPPLLPSPPSPSPPPPPPCRRLDDLSSSTDVMVCRRLPPALALPSMLQCLPIRLYLSLGHRMGGGGPAQRRWRACGAGGRSARLLVDSAVGEVMWQRAWRAGAEASHMRARPCWASAAGGSGSEREPHGESRAVATECPPRVLAWTIERNDRSVLMWYLYRASYY